MFQFLQLSPHRNTHENILFPNTLGKNINTPTRQTRIRQELLERDIASTLIAAKSLQMKMKLHRFADFRLDEILLRV